MAQDLSSLQSAQTAFSSLFNDVFNPSFYASVVEPQLKKITSKDTSVSAITQMSQDDLNKWLEEIRQVQTMLDSHMKVLQPILQFSQHVSQQLSMFQKHARKVQDVLTDINYANHIQRKKQNRFGRFPEPLRSAVRKRYYELFHDGYEEEDNEFPENGSKKLECLSIDKVSDTEAHFLISDDDGYEFLHKIVVL